MKVFFCCCFTLLEDGSISVDWLIEDGLTLCRLSLLTLHSYLLRLRHTHQHLQGACVLHIYSIYV